MKFNEKLIELRRKQGLSQEELGYRLNVTRQTVSKWELGQTTPEMEKLIEMGKLFNISVDELVNDSEITTNVNPIIEDQPIREEKTKSNKVLIIIVVALIVVILLIVYKIFSSIFSFDWFNKASDKVKQEQGNFVEDAFEIVKDAAELQDQIMENVNKNEEEQHNINMENMIEEMENIMDDSTNQFNVTKFNAGLEVHSGSVNGMIVTSVLDQIITSNKKEDRKITVKYLETETQDETQIKNIKRNFETFDKCEITYEYDAEGFINKN